MSRPLQLFQLCADLPPMIAREVAKAAMRAFSQAELTEWKALQNAARQRRFRARHKAGDPLEDNAEKMASSVTSGPTSNADAEWACVIFDAEDNDEPRIDSVTSEPLTPPSPQVPPAPPSSPTPTLTHERAVHGSIGDPGLPRSNGAGGARPKSLAEVSLHCAALGLPVSDAEAIWLKWQGNGFTNNHRRMCDWRAVIHSWQLQGYLPSQKHRSRPGDRASSRRSYPYPAPMDITTPITAF